MKRLPGANNSMNSSVSRGVRGNAALRLHAHSLDSATQEQYPNFVVGTARSQRYHILIS